MPTFLLSYRGQEARELSPDGVAAWSAWLQGMGDGLADPGNPVREATTVGNCGAGTILAGWSLVTADDLDAAVAVAGGCPILRSGGGVEVARVLELWPRPEREHEPEPEPEAGAAGRR